MPGKQEKWESGIFVSFGVRIRIGAKMGVAGNGPRQRRVYIDRPREATLGPCGVIESASDEWLKLTEYRYNLAHDFRIIAVDGGVGFIVGKQPHAGGIAMELLDGSFRSFEQGGHELALFCN